MEMDHSLINKCLLRVFCVQNRGWDHDFQTFADVFGSLHFP